jgi:excisionase family DNA binding protein
MTNKGELVTVKEAANLLRMQPSTVRKWIATRRCPYAKIGQRAVRIPKAWIDEQIRKGWREPITVGE